MSCFQRGQRVSVTLWCSSALWRSPRVCLCSLQVLTYTPLHSNGFMSIPRCKLWFTLSLGHAQPWLLNWAQGTRASQKQPLLWSDAQCLISGAAGVILHRLNNFLQHTCVVMKQTFLMPYLPSQRGQNTINKLRTSENSCHLHHTFSITHVSN